MRLAILQDYRLFTGSQNDLVILHLTVLPQSKDWAEAYCFLKYSGVLWLCVGTHLPWHAKHMRSCIIFMCGFAHDHACRVTEHGVAPEAVAEAYHAFEQGSQVSPLSAAAVSNQTIQESQRLLLLVRAYQVRCYFIGLAWLSCAVKRPALRAALFPCS